ncbi:hypothetical protein HN51_055147 [Arachis hypogaea]|uniref:Uncharacterized protein n=1 Tax=Arachis hypogaea TaxID=3818 RepID=A0A6B9VAK5_ARAHY|nr:uncharacterized protein DS421_19g655790 [Arachis hypogaea]
MVCYNMKKAFVFVAILMLGLHQINASRPLKLRDGQLLFNQKNKLQILMLPRGPVTGSQPNPCSTVPGRRRGRCAAEVNHGAYAAPPPPFPDMLANNKFGVATSINNASEDSQKDDTVQVSS